MNKVTNYLKSHLVTISYFVFFVLALLPTMFTFFNKLGLFYKAGVLIIFIAFLVVYIVKKKIKLNYRLLSIPAVILVVYALYYLAVLPTYFNYVTPEYSYISGTHVIVTTTLSMRFNSIMTMFNLCFFASLFLIISPSLGLNRSDIVCYTALIDSITLIACVVSIKEINSNGYEIGGLISFLGNKNTFGQFLMTAIFASLLSSTFVDNKFIKAGFIGVSFIYFAFVFLSKSSTAIVVSLLIIVFWFCLFIIDSKILKKYMKVAIFTVFAVALAVLLSSPYIPLLQGTKVAEVVKNLYDKIFAIKGKSFLKLFTDRGTFWALGSYIVKPEYLMLGYGNSTLEEIVFRSVVNGYTTRELMNAYLSVFDGFGILGSIIYLFILGYLFYKYFKCEEQMTEYLLVFFIAFLIYGMFESLLLFESFSGSLLLSPIMATPAVYLKVKKNKQLEEVVDNGQL